MKALDHATSAVLAPFADLIYQATHMVRALSDAELVQLIASPSRVTTTNCGWADYEAARTSWLLREAEAELQRRQDRRRRAIEEGAP